MRAFGYAVGTALGLSLLLASCGREVTEPAGPPPSPTPSGLAIQAGDNQAAGPSSPVAVPPAVIVRNAQGQPLAGVLVKWSVESGGGSLKADTARSAADGIAKAVSWRLGPLPAENRLKATAGTLPPVTFVAMGRLLVPTTLVTGSVVLPAGATLKADSLRVKTGITDVPVGLTGSYTAVSEAGVAYLGAVHAPNGNPIMFGWVDEQRKEFSARTTAEVLAYFDLGGFLQPNPEVRRAIRNYLSNGVDLSALAAAISAALAGDPTTVSLATTAIDQARRSAVQHVTAAIRAPAAIRSSGGPARGTTIDPSSEARSGVAVDQAGFRQITLTNNFRRRVAFFVDRVSYVSNGEIHDSPSTGASVELPAVLYATSVPGVIADLVSNAPVTLPVISDPQDTPLVPADATATRYKVTVVGPGGHSHAGLTMTPAQKQAFEKAGVETMLLEFFFPLIKQLFAVNEQLGSQGIPTGNEAEIVKTFLDLNPTAALDALLAGDLDGMLEEIRKILVDTDAGQNLVFDFVVGPVAKFKGLDGSTLVDGLKRWQTIFSRIEMAATGYAILKTWLDMGESNQMEQWDVTVSKAQIGLLPGSAVINLLDSQFFKVTVTDATGGGEHPVFRYRWSTTGNFGKICNAANDSGHSCDVKFTSSGDGVTYLPDGLTEGTDDISVQVYVVVGGREEVIGDASGTITTFKSKVTISPDHVSLHKNQSRQFSAIVDSRLSDGGTMSYQWTTQGQFGVFPFGETNATTSLPSILYTVTSDEEGSEVVTVEAFSTKDGVRRSLGSGSATVEIEKDQPTIVQGRWFISPPTPLDKGRSCVAAYMEVPLVSDAKSYAVNAHGFHDGTGAYPGPITRTLTPPFPSFQPCSLAGWGRSGSDGASYVFFLSGFAGPDASIGGAVASFQSRFGGMQVEVTVRY